MAKLVLSPRPRGSARRSPRPLAAHHATAPVIWGELGELGDCRFGPPANRSVVGIMTEFSFLADVYRRNDPGIESLQLGKRLAETP